MSRQKDELGNGHRRNYYCCCVHEPHLLQQDLLIHCANRSSQPEPMILTDGCQRLNRNLAKKLTNSEGLVYSQAKELK